MRNLLNLFTEAFLSLTRGPISTSVDKLDAAAAWVTRLRVLEGRPEDYNPPNPLCGLMRCQTPTFVGWVLLTISPSELAVCIAPFANCVLSMVREEGGGGSRWC